MDFTPPTHALELSRQFRGALDTDEGIAAAATVTRIPNYLLQVICCSNLPMRGNGTHFTQLSSVDVPRAGLTCVNRPRLHPTTGWGLCCGYRYLPTDSLSWHSNLGDGVATWLHPEVTTPVGPSGRIDTAGCGNLFLLITCYNGVPMCMMMF